MGQVIANRPERDGRRHSGKLRMKQLREALTLLREITDPWA